LHVLRTESGPRPWAITQLVRHRPIQHQHALARPDTITSRLTENTVSQHHMTETTATDTRQGRGTRQPEGLVPSRPTDDTASQNISPAPTDTDMREGRGTRQPEGLVTSQTSPSISGYHADHSRPIQSIWITPTRRPSLHPTDVVTQDSARAQPRPDRPTERVLVDCAHIASRLGTNLWQYTVYLTGSAWKIGFLPALEETDRTSPLDETPRTQTESPHHVASSSTVSRVIRREDLPSSPSHPPSLAAHRLESRPLPRQVSEWLVNQRFYALPSRAVIPPTALIRPEPSFDSLSLPAAEFRWMHQWLADRCDHSTLATPLVRSIPEVVMFWLCVWYEREEQREMGLGMTFQQWLDFWLARSG
jgi:hypothetical protein